MVFFEVEWFIGGAGLGGGEFEELCGGMWDDFDIPAFVEDDDGFFVGGVGGDVFVECGEVGVVRGGAEFEEFGEADEALFGFAVPEVGFAAIEDGVGPGEPDAVMVEMGFGEIVGDKCALG